MPARRAVRTGKNWVIQQTRYPTPYRAVAVAGPALVVAVVAAVTFAGLRRAADADRSVEHTLSVSATLENTKTRLTDAETGQRGYVLTGRDSYLQPWLSGRLGTLRAIAALRALTADNPIQQPRLDTLEHLAQQKLAELNTTIALRRDVGLDAALRVVQTDHGKATMDSARSVLGEMSAEEWGLLIARTSAAAYWRTVTMWALVLGSIVAGLLALGVNALFARHAAVEAQAARELDVRATQLQEQAMELELQNQQLQDQAVELESQTAELEVSSDELRRANLLLHEQEERLSRLVETTPDGIIETDSAGRLVFANTAAERMLQLRSAMLRDGRDDAPPVGSITDPFQAYWSRQAPALPRAITHFTNAIGATNGSTDEVEHAVELVDGSRAIISVRARPLRGMDGTIVGSVAVFTDVTARKQVELERDRALVEAQAANQAKSAFLATMSHELRTPLNAIGGYADLIDLEIRGPVTPAQREDLRRIRSAGQYLLGLINDVLNFVRLESAQVRYDIADVALEAALSEAASMVEPQAMAKGVLFKRQPTDSAIAVRADREKLLQVVLNLLSNAMKFTPSGGLVVLADEVIGDSTVQITVKDSGPGIPADKLELIFRPFVQIGRGLSNPLPGVGLGLAISRELARMMGGDLTAESVVGRGSTFRFTLPLTSSLFSAATLRSNGTHSTR